MKKSSQYVPTRNDAFSIMVFYSLAKFYTTIVINWWELNCFGCVAGLGLGRRPAFNSRPCFPSEGKGPNWDLGVRTLKLSSEDSEDKLGFWVSCKDHWWTICNCRSGSPIQPSFSISYPDSAFTDPENYFTWGIVIHQCYIKNVISYIVEEE